MAQFKIHGLVELRQSIAEIAELGGDGGKVANQMLREGTKEVKKVWNEESIKRHKLTGKMAAAVDSSKVKKNRIGRFTVTYPMGYEEPDRVRRGKPYRIRNAEKEFYNHYGFMNKLTGRFVQGDRWVDKIDMIAEPKSDAAMQKIWDDYLKKAMKKGGK